MEIRRVNLNEINEVMEIIKDAKALLKKTSTQWQSGYPNIDSMTNDINNNSLYGAFVNSKLVGIIALIKGINPDYDIIDGAWITEHSENDLVIHRIAVKDGYHNLNIGDSLFKFAIKYAKNNNFSSVKVDTHEKNIAVQRLCQKNDFKYCGIIYIKREKVEPKRLAYEFTL